MWQLSGGALLGWSLGANDAANVFGTAVSARMVKYSTAVILTSVFVVLGAWLQGGQGLETYRDLHAQNLNTAFITTLSAASIVGLMTFLSIPVSTSQAIVGAIAGIAAALYIVEGRCGMEWGSMVKILICWIMTPAGAAFAAVIIYGLFKLVFRIWNPSLLTRNTSVKVLLIGAGSYAAYALGANNLANVTGPFFGPGRSMLTGGQAALLGGTAIAMGVLTFSRRVMHTVGRRIVPLDPLSALVTICAEAVTVHVYAIIGVPVSTSQAIVGAVAGIGIIKGMQTVDRRVLSGICIGWVLTPVGAALLACLLSLLFL